MPGCGSKGLCAVVGHSLDGYAIVTALASVSLLCIALALLCYLQRAEAVGSLTGFGRHQSAVSLLWLMATIFGALGMSSLMPTVDTTSRHTRSVALASFSAVGLLVEFALLDSLWWTSNASALRSSTQYRAIAALVVLILVTATLCLSAFMQMGVQGELSGQSVEGSVRDCLCIFDVDRTLTSKQSWAKPNGQIRCPQSKRQDGVYDTEFGGGTLVTSALTEQLRATFCGSTCFLGVLTAGDAGGKRDFLLEALRSTAHGHAIPAEASSAWADATAAREGGSKAPLLTRVVNGAKHLYVPAVLAFYSEQHVAIADHRVFFFDDLLVNVEGFVHTAYNARQVSCASRDDGAIGGCGAIPEEVVPTVGILACDLQQRPNSSTINMLELHRQQSPLVPRAEAETFEAGFFESALLDVSRERDAWRLHAVGAELRACDAMALAAFMLFVLLFGTAWRRFHHRCGSTDKGDEEVLARLTPSKEREVERQDAIT